MTAVLSIWVRIPLEMVIERMTGSNPVLTTIASRFDGRVKVPLLEKSNDSWKDSNIVRWRNWIKQGDAVDPATSDTGSNPVLTT